MKIQLSGANYHELDFSQYRAGGPARAGH
jgi:hypothetical protein